MDMVDILSKTSDFKLIEGEIKKNTLSDAILLISKDSIYSFEFALALAQLLFYGNIQKDDNFLKIHSGGHPDLKIYPLKDKLLVADSEEIVSECYAAPVLADKKMIIIKDFDNSMEQAQNKLLKILEEPPANVFLILTCSNANLVLPTIRSRCNKYELKKVESRVVETCLQGRPNAQLIASLCDGYLGRADSLSKLSYLPELFDNVIALLTKMTSSKQVLTFSKNILPYKDHFDLIIEILSFALEDLLLLKAGRASEVRLQTAREALQSVSDSYSIKAICELQLLLNKAVKEQLYNTNFTLIIENLLLNILEVKFICK